MTYHVAVPAAITPPLEERRHKRMAQATVLILDFTIRVFRDGLAHLWNK